MSDANIKRGVCKVDQALANLDLTAPAVCSTVSQAIRDLTTVFDSLDSLNDTRAVNAVFAAFMNRQFKATGWLWTVNEKSGELSRDYITSGINRDVIAEAFE